MLVHLLVPVYQHGSRLKICFDMKLTFVQRCNVILCLYPDLCIIRHVFLIYNAGGIWYISA